MMNATHKGIITLLRSGVTGEKLLLPTDFSLEDAFVLMQRQSVIPLAYQGAMNCGVPNNHSVMKKC